MNAVLNAPDTAEFTLTDDQQAALDGFVGFLLSPVEKVFVVEGYAGTGKSTLVKTLIDRLPGYIKAAQLIDPDYQALEVVLTATTNKAAEAFSYISGMSVSTIHSHLGLRVDTNFKTGITNLIPRNNSQQYNQLIFIDEASYVDRQLLGLVFSQTVNCKIVFIGDRAQLSPVKSTGVPPVFAANFNGVMLTKVMRQMVNGVPQTNPITELATQFRETVSTGIWKPFKPDGQYVIHIPRSDFEDMILADMMNPDWRYKDSKVLGWTNKCVIAYNHAISDHLKGDPSFQVGDYAVCNKYVTANRVSIKTDQMVCITSIEEDIEEHDVLGNFMTLDYKERFFCPKSLEAKKQRLKTAKATGNYQLVEKIESSWIDLRAAFAQTINKSQGSTYDRVFIDLDDLRRCNSGDQLARMMYVGTSRARHKVYLTGDLA